MRLYIKLIALLLATATLQRSLLSNDTPSEIWFGLRCSFAYTIHDKQMIDKLAEEARDIRFHSTVRVHAAGG